MAKVTISIEDKLGADGIATGEVHVSCVFDPPITNGMTEDDATSAQMLAVELLNELQDSAVPGTYEETITPPDDNAPRSVESIIASQAIASANAAAREAARAEHDLGGEG